MRTNREQGRSRARPRAAWVRVPLAIATAAAVAGLDAANEPADVATARQARGVSEAEPPS